MGATAEKDLLDSRGRIDVLVVDDDPIIAGMIRDVLEGEKLRVAVAYDGARGLELSRTVGPRVVLTDVMMPRMSGDQLARALLEQADPSPRVVYMSAAVPPPSGGTAFLHKPFEITALLAVVRQALLLGGQQRFN
jgi:CheY-like chemotaxis protein